MSSSAIGCAFPNLAPLAFGHVQARMGSASALLGTTQSAFGGIAGALVGTLANGKTLPVIGIMAGFAFLVTVFLAMTEWKQHK